MMLILVMMMIMLTNVCNDNGCNQLTIAPWPFQALFFSAKWSMVSSALTYSIYIAAQVGSFIIVIFNKI